MSKFDFVSTPVTEIFGMNSFSDVQMKSRLPKSIYKEFKKVQNGEQELTLAVAEVVAGAMRDWALEKGASHYTHWFQPLTGVTAEKHDSFISPTGDGKVIMEFSGKELIKGEPDASSFPNGGIRATFEARGYTAWDTTSPAFLRQDNTGVTLYIPTAFVSYTGEALDKKVPLLRSMDALGTQALRVLKALGNKTSNKVITTVGAEQEYFLIDEQYFAKRSDLMLAGRTLFGANTAKGQELEAHYFGTIKERVADFMREFNLELWKIGVTSKTQHNEVAPNQFELAPIFEISNVATDANQVTMDILKKVATRHGLVALLHEKPFAGVNGSGKHNNWSLGTDDGLNLLEPGANPHQNAQFLVFLSAVVKAVDMYAPLLRVSAACAGNDHRLGANEAPPAIISIFLGDQLSDILKAVSEGKESIGQEGKKMEIGVTCLPKLPMDLTDRNRTSPFAFTGNKFEFRMVASSASISAANVVLNTAVTEILEGFATRLEEATDVNAEIKNIISDTYKAHSKVIFNGNGYGDEWLVEAEKRGLPNLVSTIDALPELVKDYSKDLFEKHKVLSNVEVESRFNIYVEEYSEQLLVEANLTAEMAMKEIFPVATEYAAQLAGSVGAIKAVSEAIDTSAQEELITELVSNTKKLKDSSSKLVEATSIAHNTEDALEQAKAFRSILLNEMAAVREAGDKLETLTDKSLWPFPTYEDLLFRL